MITRSDKPAACPYEKERTRNLTAGGRHADIRFQFYEFGLIAFAVSLQHDRVEEVHLVSKFLESALVHAIGERAPRIDRLQQTAGLG